MLARNEINDGEDKVQSQNRNFILPLTRYCNENIKTASWSHNHPNHANNDTASHNDNIDRKSDAHWIPATLQALVEYLIIIQVNATQHFSFHSHLLPLGSHFFPEMFPVTFSDFFLLNSRPCHTIWSWLYHHCFRTHLQCTKQLTVKTHQANFRVPVTLRPSKLRLMCFDYKSFQLFFAKIQ